MAPSWQQLLIVLVLVLVLFGGRGRISSLMGDMAQGIKSFRSGLKDDENEQGAATLTAAPPPGDPAVTTATAAGSAADASSATAPAETRRDV